MENVGENKKLNLDLKPNYTDDQDEISFYVQNISQGDVILTDIGVKVAIMGVVDLREYQDIDRLKKSTSLRQALSTKVNWLKRITHDQYLKLMEIQARRDARIEGYKKDVIEKKQNALTDENAKDKIKEVKIDISPKVQSQVEKLRLHYKGQVKNYTPEDFLMFVASNKLNEDERTYVLGVVKETEIREAVLAQDNQ